VLSYRATAYLKDGQYDNALLDCQTLAEEYSMDANSYFLTGMVALEMDSYEEASTNFDYAYAENATYEMAIRIYQVYLDKDMEADGTKYLEVALQNEAKTAEDYCDRGKVYYYMEDYEKARAELTTAANQDNVEALLLLGMVYLGQNDISNARSMYQEYITQAGSAAKGYNGLAQCDIAESSYDSALSNITEGLKSATTEEMQDLLSNEIVVYERQLDFETAREKAEEYLAMFPGDEAVTRELTFLKSRTRVYEETVSEDAESSEGTEEQQ
jgi:tetratricopeptide (TPR) repeat protein